MSKDSSAEASQVAADSGGGQLDDTALLDGYPGACVLVSADGQPVLANEKGAGVDALLRNGSLPDVSEMITLAAAEQRIVAGPVTLESSKGEVAIEVTVIPKTDGRLLGLTRDLTMERNLRSALVESRQRYKDLVEVSSDFSWEVDADGKFVFVSPRGALGYTAEELLGREPSEFVANPDDFSPSPFASERPLENVEMWFAHKDSSTACMILSCVPLFEETANGQNWRGVRGVCRDVTDERESEAALTRARNREQILNYIVSMVRDELEPENMLAAAASATGRALGVAGCRIYRQLEPGRIMVAAEHGNSEGIDGIEEKLSDSGEEARVLSFETGKWQVLTAPTRYRQIVNGAIAIWKVAGGEGWDGDNELLLGDVANQLGIANEQIANHESIVALSRTDGMTGLLNRRAFFEEELPRRIARLERSREQASLFYVDMDNFKRVNDVHGHQAGDDAIMFLRDMMMEFSRPGDVISRLGGDEFAMWLDGITPEVTEKRAGALLKASEAMLEFSGDADHPLGISVGIANYDPADSEPLDELLARADHAMYAAKHAGKGGFQIAPPAGTAIETPEH